MQTVELTQLTHPLMCLQRNEWKLGDAKQPPKVQHRKLGLQVYLGFPPGPGLLSWCLLEEEASGIRNEMLGKQRKNNRCDKT